MVVSRRQWWQISLQWSQRCTNWFPLFTEPGHHAKHAFPACFYFLHQLVDRILNLLLKGNKLLLSQSTASEVAHNLPCLCHIFTPVIVQLLFLTTRLSAWAMKIVCLTFMFWAPSVTRRGCLALIFHSSIMVVLVAAMLAAVCDCGKWPTQKMA